MKKDTANPNINIRGLAWGFASYVMWGFFPLYWKLLGHRPAMEILFHRMIWSFAFYLLLFSVASPKKIALLFKQSKKDWLLSATASLLLAINWGIYIYAVNSGHILEGSLAYFINPILNVAVGILFFKEANPLTLRLSIGFAALGVAARIFYATTFPWISLILATTFCLYGITKKMLKIPATTSSVLEGAAGFIPALIGIAYFTQAQTPLDSETWVLLVLGGVVTGLPLFLFSFAAQRVPYSVMGLLQFIAPSLQFIVGVYVFHEPFRSTDAVSFGFIWVGILFYGLTKVKNLRRSSRGQSLH